MARKGSRKKRDSFVQGDLPFPPGRGGKRKGAGRKPKGEKAGVEHRPREEFRRASPVLVTLKVCPGLPSLRTSGAVRAIEESFAAANAKELVSGPASEARFRIVHFSIQSNHVHLLVEARSSETLSRGVQGLTVRIARALNRWWVRKGRVFADRFHSCLVSCPRQMRNVLRYVLTNARKHGIRLSRWDPCSSAADFDGWLDERSSGRRALVPPGAPNRPSLRVLPARTWFARVGWKQWGLLRLHERPA